MARINTNVSAVTAQRHLNRSYAALNTTLERLSSGLRINRGADDPAGLIVSERLRAEISAVNQAITNTQRASNIITTTEGALNEVASLLTDIKDLIVEAANEGALSEDEIKANQLQIDSAISSITRIANATTFVGRNLLDGSLDYITSGVDNSVVHALSLNNVQFGTQPFIPVDVNVTVSAQPGQLFFPAGSITSSVTIEIRGNEGTTTLSLTSGQSASSIVDAINQVKDATGVVATLSGSPTSGFMLASVGLGSRQFVSVQVLPGSGTFDLYANPGPPAGTSIIRDEGRDARALVNGALALADGNALSLRTATLDMELTLANTFGVGTTSFAITEGGSLFQVGPEVNTSLQVGIGVRSVAASRLGNTALGFLSQVITGERFSLLAREYASAGQIVDEAIRQVSVVRGRLGSFEKNTLDTNVNSLGITMENLVAAESIIRDADFAYETSQLTRNQILVSAGTSVLALANQTPQTVLNLLG